MRALPIGFPKVMVSTLASGNTAQYVGVKDIVMFPSIFDVAGLTRVSRQIFTLAAGAICGMVDVAALLSTLAAPEDRFPARQPDARPTGPLADKPIVVASQFGNTT